MASIIAVILFVVFFIVLMILPWGDDPMGGP